MKKICTLVFTLFVFTSYAQDIYPPNAWFAQTSVVPCPFDPTVNIQVFDDWEFYQTLNNRWDGTVDSSQCLGLFDFAGEKRFLLNQIDPDRALFIRSRVSDDLKRHPLLFFSLLESKGCLLRASLANQIRIVRNCEMHPIFSKSDHLLSFHF